MPPRSIKVVEMNPQVEEPSHEEEAVQSEQEQEQVQAEETSDQCEIDSDDLAVLVKEYADERRQKLKESEPKMVCQYCDKSMSAKSLKYSHQKNCKQDPRNKPPPPPPPTPIPAPIVAKPKRRAPVKKTVDLEKRVAEQYLTIEIQPPVKEDITQPFTTNYIRLATVRNAERVELKKKRMKSLASQAF